MTTGRRRGRPRNAESPRTAKADAAIAQAAHQLVMWGFPTKVAFAAVAQEAGRLGRAVGEKRVEQLVAAWTSAPFPAPKGTPMVRGVRTNYSKASLREHMPPSARGQTAYELAAQLLASDGAWPEEEEEEIPACDLELTPAGDLVLTFAAAARRARAAAPDLPAGDLEVTPAAAARAAAPGRPRLRPPKKTP